MSLTHKISLSAALLASAALAQEAPIDCFKTDLALTGTPADGAPMISDMSLLTGETSEITMSHVITKVEVCYRVNNERSRLESLQTTHAIWNEEGTETSAEVVSPLIGLVAPDVQICDSLVLAKDEKITSFTASAITFLTKMTFETTLQDSVVLGLGWNTEEAGETENFAPTGLGFSGFMGNVAEGSYLSTVRPIGYENACLDEAVTTLGRDFGWTVAQIEAKRAENAANDAANEIIDDGAETDEDEDADNDLDNEDEDNENNSNVVDKPDDSKVPSDYEDIKDERDMFQLLFIIFVVLFIITMIIAIFLMIKMKRTKERNFVSNHTLTETQLVKSSNDLTTSQVEASSYPTKK